MKKKQDFYLHQQDLLEHSKNPQNYGLLSSYDFISAEYNPSCGDSIIINGLIENDQIKEIHFEGSGCMLSIAMASKLTQFTKKMTVLNALALDTSIIYQLLNVELGPNRIQCAILAINALRNGLLSFQKKEKTTQNPF
ncbi:iron-sulfur cluster assembly scaffold protein [Candidatus Dependentiae bacterium]|nr:iron-sulfur cluster assembly scaffold protein [Candidatus Dependentiae bacterium]